MANKNIQLLPDPDSIQQLIEWAYSEMDPQKQFDAATEMCEAIKNAVDLEQSHLVDPTKVDELVQTVQPHLLFLLNSVRSSTVRTYAARAFGYECKRRRPLVRQIHDAFTETLLRTISDCVKRYQERKEKEVRDKYLSLCESCLWPLTECVKDQLLRTSILNKLSVNEELLQNLLFIIQLDHSGTKTNLCALLIRMLKEDEDGRCWQMLTNVRFGQRVEGLLKDHERHAGAANPNAYEPDWIRNLKTLDRLMKKGKSGKKNKIPIVPDNSMVERRVFNNCREMGVSASMEDVRAALANVNRSSNEADRINAAVMYIFDKQSSGSSKSWAKASDPDIMSRLEEPAGSLSSNGSVSYDRQHSNPNRREMGPPQPSNHNGQLMFVGLQSDPVCFDRVIPDSLAPAVLDFAEEERVIQEAISTSQYNVSWCFDVLTLTNFFKVIYHFNILHISGHGHPNKFLVEDGHGIVSQIPAADLRNIKLRDRRLHSLRLVFVSMCHSEDVAREFVKMGVPHVVAVNNAEKVKDSMAVAFANHFYNLFIAQGQTLKEAFDGAQSFCSVRFPKSKSPLILLPDDGSENHDVTLEELFSDICPNIMMDASSEENLRTFKRTPCNNIPCSRTTIGRHFDILKGFCLLYKKTHNRFMIYHGAPHVGKRTVVGLMAFTVHRLKKAKDGVLYVPFSRRISSLEEFVKRIFDEIQRLSKNGKAIDGLGEVLPKAESVSQYLRNKDMCIFFVCEHGNEITDWLPEDDEVLLQVAEYIHRFQMIGCEKLKFVVCVSKPGLDRLQKCGDFWRHLPEVQVNLMDTIQAKALVRQSVHRFIGDENKASKMHHTINTSGIFKPEFGLPLSPRIVEKLVLLCCRKGVDITFLIHVLRSKKMKKMLKVAQRQCPLAVQDLENWKASVEDLNFYIESKYI